MTEYKIEAFELYNVETEKGVALFKREVDARHLLLSVGGETLGVRHASIDLRIFESREEYEQEVVLKGALEKLSQTEIEVLREHWNVGHPPGGRKMGRTIRIEGISVCQAPNWRWKSHDDE